ncbi:hypothetical protein WAI453_003128 [Rhynchosporium graminicola]
MPGSTWTGDADRDMLLTIIEEGGSGKSIPWPEVARNLQTKGYTFSHEACRYCDLNLNLEVEIYRPRT